jgi:RNase P subunit RPR2
MLLDACRQYREALAAARAGDLAEAFDSATEAQWRRGLVAALTAERSATPSLERVTRLAHHVMLKIHDIVADAAKSVICKRCEKPTTRDDRLPMKRGGVVHFACTAADELARRRKAAGT